MTVFMKNSVLDTANTKSVCIWSYSGLYFPAFLPNTERYSVSLRIQSECKKIQTRITTDTDIFHAVRCLTGF